MSAAFLPRAGVASIVHWAGGVKSKMPEGRPCRVPCRLQHLLEWAGEGCEERALPVKDIFVLRAGSVLVTVSENSQAAIFPFEDLPRP